MTHRPPVMLSSTARDLTEHREQARDACLAAGFFPEMMEHLTARTDDAIRTSLEMVSRCEYYVIVLGWRYGYVPPGHSKSITEMELDHAIERKIPVMAFLMDPDHDVKVGDIDRGEARTRLDELRARLEEKCVRGSFASPDALRAQLVHSLMELRSVEEVPPHIRMLTA